MASLLNVGRGLVGSNKEKNMVVTYDIIDTSVSTKLLERNTNVKTMWIDNVEQPTLVKNYTFDTIGLHVVKYECKNNTFIELQMFDVCNRIVSVYVPESFIEFGDYCFRNCSNLSQINIPENIVYIGHSSLMNTNITGDIVLPLSLVTLKIYAFSGTKITSIFINDNISVLERSCFHNCSQLISAHLPNNITVLEADMFFNCHELEIVNIPLQTTSIENGFLTNCFKLRQIDIPNNVNSIGPNAFQNDRISTMFVRSVVPPSISSNLSGNFGVIYVPSESVEAYKSATGWSAHASKIQAIPNN